jgi:hypothetical protein
MYVLATKIKINMTTEKPPQNILKKAIESIMANQKQTWQG